MGPRVRRRVLGLAAVPPALVLLAVLAVLAVLATVLAGQPLSAPTPPAQAAAAADARLAVPAEAPRRPNLVVVMADDMRFDDLRFAPRLRKLARRGVTFENSFSPFPLCCPARASFLTGRLSHNHDVYWHEPPHGYGAFDDSRTLATSLEHAGYRTGFVGKYLNRYGRDRSLVSGEPSYRYVPRGWTDWYAAVENPGVPGMRGGTYHYFSTPFNINGTWKNHVGTYQTRVVGRYSRRLVRRYHRRRGPFFLYVNYLAPHNGAPTEGDDPRRVHDRAGNLVDFNTPARPDRVKGRFDRVVDRAAGVPRRGGPVERDVSDKPGYLSGRREPSREQRRAGRELTRQRAEAIWVMDRDIARTVRRLKETGEWADTVFVFTSDNGFYLGEHRIMQGKVHGHEPSLRVPLIVSGPGLRDGSDRHDPATTVDVTATLLDLAGAEPPRRQDGTSLVDTLYGGDRGWRRAVPIESSVGTRQRGSVFGARDYRFSVGVRTSRYTYIRLRSGARELYDLARDPHQLRSVAGDRDYRPVRRALDEVMERLEECVGRQCRVALPPDLAAGPVANRRTTLEWLRDHRRRYGWQR